MRYHKADPFYPSEETIRIAAEVIVSGGVVCYPTETLYGLGGDALSLEVIHRINRAKERPENTPCIMLIDKNEADKWIANVSRIEPIIYRYWPGPLTLIVEPANRKHPPMNIAPDGSIGLRAASLPLDIAIVRRAGRPFISTSANRNTEPPRTTIEGIESWLETFCDLVLDGGEIDSADPSTLIDVRHFPEKITIIREGAIAISALQMDFPETEFDFAFEL
ncbi:MAG TPA: Sua5/YciO/YrdC/YwlC family protein [candidate division Zixibacteria bacterium]|nr:Sua5/YciO/YrdC/YwlC family protein [candidate division Zixibacteria bacterium]